MDKLGNKHCREGFLQIVIESWIPQEEIFEAFHYISQLVKYGIKKNIYHISLPFKYRLKSIFEQLILFTMFFEFVTCPRYKLRYIDFFLT